MDFSVPPIWHLHSVKPKCVIFTLTDAVDHDIAISVNASHAYKHELYCQLIPQVSALNAKGIVTSAVMQESTCLLISKTDPCTRYEHEKIKFLSRDALG